MPILNSRQDDSNTTKDSTYIVVFTILGVLVFGAFTALFVKFVARRVVSSRQAHRGGGTFVLVNGATRTRTRDTFHDVEAEKTRMEKELIQANAYSRDISKDEPAIFLREVTPTPAHAPLVSTPYILDGMPTLGGTHSRSNSPHSGHGPFRFALRTASALSRDIPSRASTGRSSVGGSSYRTANSRFSRASMTPSAIEFGAVLTVQQIFTPMLPDELAIRQVGEGLTLVESFDDGWALVTRQPIRDGQGTFDSATSAVKALFLPSKRNNNDPREREDTELGENIGFIPSWCFAKEAPGLKPQRPMRSSSLPASAIQL